MKIKNYLDKNYPSINWNILSQLFEEEGIELTEEIRDYLNTTPWNTNANILANWGIVGESDSEPSESFTVTYTVQTNAQQAGYANGTLPKWFTDDEITVIFEGETYTVPKKIESLYGGVDTIIYGDIFGDGSPRFTDYPFCIQSEVGGDTISPDWKAIFSTQEAGTYEVTIIYSTETDTEL